MSPSWHSAGPECSCVDDRFPVVRHDGRMPRRPRPLLPPDELEALRTALIDYTVDGVHELLGLAGQAAHDRGDLAGVARVVRAAAAGGDAATRRLATLVRLFLLGHAVDEADARAALAPARSGRGLAGRLVAASAGSVRATVDLRPIVAEGGPPAWVVSDFGSDVRPGPLRRDHVLGVGSASLTLAQATPRTPVGRALDLGTGCGVQALFLGPARRTGRRYRRQHPRAALRGHLRRAERAGLGPAPGVAAGPGGRRALRPRRRQPAVRRVRGRQRLRLPRRRPGRGRGAARSWWPACRACSRRAARRCCSRTGS